MKTNKVHRHPGECFEGSEVCRLEDSSERHRIYWAELAEGKHESNGRPAVRNEDQCFYRDEWDGERLPCPPCGPGRNIKIFHCSKFDLPTTLLSTPVEAGTTCHKCVFKTEFPPDLVRINQGAGGLGDTLMGLCVVNAFAKRIGRPVSLGVNPLWSDFCGLFRLPFALHAQIHDRNLPLNPDRSQLQMNCGYQLETVMLGSRCGIPRAERYARNIGSSGFEIPELRDVAGHLERGKRWRGAIVLAPFGSHAHREWRVESWVSLENELKRRGYRTVVFHRDVSGQVGPERKCDPIDCLRSERAIDLSARDAVDLVANAAFVVSNDSGPAHLGGILRRPTLALCGQTRAEDIYSCYPTVYGMNGHLDCRGCYWNEPNIGGPYNPSRCLPSCANLQSIGFQEVADFIDQVILPAAAAGKTILCWQRLQVLRSAAIAASGKPGSLAEAGCYNGGASLLMSHFCSDSELHLFDALGLPEDDEHLQGRHRKGEFAGTADALRSLPWKCPVHFHFGRLPSTFEGLDTLRFKLVHLDLDTYQATRDALRWFWPRMVKSGQILLDDVDWPHCPGVRQALNEVLPDVDVEKTHAVQGRVTK